MKAEASSPPTPPVEPGSAPTQTPVAQQLVCLGDLADLFHIAIPHTWFYGIARWHGRLRWATNRRLREVVRDNLRDVPGLSATELRRATRVFLENKQLRLLLMFLFPRLTSRAVEQLWPIEGLSHLDAALAGEKGALLVMSHLNSTMNLIARDRLLRLGYDFRIAFPAEEKPYQPTRFHQLVDRMRKPNDVPNRRDFHALFNIRPIVRALGEGAVIGLTGDGWHSAGVAKVTFLGREVYFTTGAASISRTMGCPIVPMFVTGTAPDRMRIVIEEPLVPEKTDDSARDLQIMVRRYVDRLDYHLRQSPLAWEHWFEPRAMDTMATLLDKTLRERYRL